MTMTLPCLDDTVRLLLDEESNLRCLARGLTRSNSDTDELVQETMLRAYRARDRFRPGTSMRAWTSTILRRLFLTNIRRARIHRVKTETDVGRTFDGLDARASTARYDRPHDAERLGDSLDDAVKQALERVPEVYRTAFLLSAVGEMSCAEIGHTLGVPIGTVMSRVHRAREQLRNELLRPRAGRTAAKRESVCS